MALFTLLPFVAFGIDKPNFLHYTFLNIIPPMMCFLIQRKMCENP